MQRLTVVLVAGALTVAGAALALNPGSEVFVASAGRGAGAGDSMWVTDLYILNPNEGAVTVALYPLDRNANNAAVAPVILDVSPEASLVLPDVVLHTLGLETWFGAFRLESVAPIVVNTRIYNLSAAGTFGQGFAGVPADAVPDDSGFTTTHILGIGQNESFRTNVVAVEADGPGGSTELELRLLDRWGSEVATESGLSLRPWEARSWSVSSLFGAEIDDGILEVRVVDGAALVFASKVDEGTGDPTTLEPWWPLDDSDR